MPPAGYNYKQNTPFLPLNVFHLTSSITLFLTVHFRANLDPTTQKSTSPAPLVAVGERGCRPLPCPPWWDILTQAYLGYLSDYLSLFPLHWEL